jgi:hypothetical protein
VKQIVVISLSLSLLTNCGVLSRSKSLSVEDYAQWYAKEKFVFSTKQEVNAVQYELTYVPYEFQVGYALKQGNLTLDEAKRMQGDFTNEHTFKLSLVLPNQGKDIYSYNEKSQLSKEQKMLYYLNDLKKDVLLINKSGDTLPCINALLEIGISNMNVATFLFDFNKIERNQIKELNFQDKLLSEQMVAFDLSKMNLKRIPKLSLKGYGK